MIFGKKKGVVAEPPGDPMNRWPTDAVQVELDDGGIGALDVEVITRDNQ